MINKNTNVLIVGLGVIGGSYARALTKKGYKVSAISKNQEDIDYAIKNGIIYKGTTIIDEKIISSADLIIFALYPQIFIDWIDKYNTLLKKNAIITDVTGVKSSIVDRVQSVLREDLEFIAAHPMAGKESYGIINSDDSIFNGANYIVVPTEKNTDNAIQICKDLGKTLGFAKVSVLSVKKHDEMIAFLSQLTHCIAICLMTCNTSEGLEKYTGDSFRDLTRIANINEDMWSELFLLNKDYLINMMDLFIGDFEKMRYLISSGDIEGIKEMMRISTERRKLFDKLEMED